MASAVDAAAAAAEAAALSRGSFFSVAGHRLLLSRLPLLMPELSVPSCSS